MTESLIGSTEPSSNNRLDDLESMLDSEEHYPDVVLLVGVDKRPILAHRCILSLRSPAFKATFQRHTSTGEFEIADVEYEAMMELLRFLYARRVRDVRSLRGELSRAAEKYGVDELKAICDAAAGESETYVAYALECRLCRESSFDSASSLNDHVRAKHAARIRSSPAGSNDETIEPAGREVYTCRLCASLFLARCEVVEHSTKVHDDVDCTFLCAKCLVSFRGMQALEDHECAKTRDNVETLVSVVVSARTSSAASEAAAVPIERLARFLARQEPKKARYEGGTRKRHQKTACPRCQKMFAYRKSLNDHIIFEHVVPCEADGASKAMAVELLRLVNDSATSDHAKIEELAIAIGMCRDDGARV